MQNPLRVAARVFTGSTYAILGADALRAPGSSPRAGRGDPGRDPKGLSGAARGRQRCLCRNAAVMVGAGTLLALGRVPRLSALTLAASLIPTTLAGHSYWTIEDPVARKTQRIQFHKNLAMLGGLLLAAIDRP